MDFCKLNYSKNITADMFTIGSTIAAEIVVIEPKKQPLGFFLALSLGSGGCS